MDEQLVFETPEFKALSGAYKVLLKANDEAIEDKDSPQWAKFKLISAVEHVGQQIDELFGGESWD